MSLRVLMAKAKEKPKPKEKKDDKKSMDTLKKMLAVHEEAEASAGEPMLADAGEGEADLASDLDKLLMILGKKK